MKTTQMTKCQKWTTNSPALAPETAHPQIFVLLLRGIQQPRGLVMQAENLV